MLNLIFDFSALKIKSAVKALFKASNP